MYCCRLEAQPDHLTPAWLLARNRHDSGGARLSFSAGLTQQSETLWVLDPATGVRCPYVLQPATWMALRTWRSKGTVPATGLIDLLRTAGIVSTADAREAILAGWQKTVIACRGSLERGYVPVRGLIHPFQLSALRRYYRRLIRRKRLRFGDSQCSRRFVAHNEPVASFFHRQLTGAVSELLGKKVKPSYCYVIGYQGGAELERHVDREQCEYTLALCLDFSPEPRRGTPWPLQLQLPGETVSVHQALGDALLYEGRRIPHSRSRLADGCTSTSILFHYVDIDFEGPLR